MNCKEHDYQGIIEDGICKQCGVAAQTKFAQPTAIPSQAVLESLKQLLTAREIAPSKEDLSRASNMLTTVTPYNYDAWRLHTDLLLSALRQLETRQLQPDPSFTLLAIPLREDDLRDAAEAAFRQCAHYAQSAEDRIALVDEANRVRRKTWF
jgi:Protein kinase G tetratricopeptide repeat